MRIAFNSSENIILKLEKVYHLIDEWKESNSHIETPERYRILNLISIKKREIEKNVSAFKKSCAANYDEIRVLIDRQLREILSYIEPYSFRQISV